MPPQKEIIYPVFLECCQFATDMFWETIFEDLAYGKTPYGTYITKDFLCCSYKNKEFSYKIEKKDPQKMYNEVYNLLTNKLGLLSQQEKIKKRLDFNAIEENIKDSRQSWTSIRKKNVKDLLVEKYVIEMKIIHSLSLAQTRYLLSLIYIAMVFKVITAKDIVYENGKIEKIDGIDFAKKQILVQRDMYNAEVNTSTSNIIDRKSMINSWEKYLKELRKINSK